MLTNLDLRRMSLKDDLASFECCRHRSWLSCNLSEVLPFRETRNLDTGLGLQKTAVYLLSCPLRILFDTFLLLLSKMVQVIAFVAMCMVLNPISTSAVSMALSWTMFLNFVARWR